MGRATAFIEEHSSKSSPFFLYMPLIHTHIPHTPKKKFVKEATQAHREAAKRAKKEVEGGEKLVYGASLREADDMVKSVVEGLERAGKTVFANTLTIVTSDNGPWLSQDAMGGSPLPFRGGKFSTNEGGVRVFCIAHWPRVFGSHVHRHHPTEVIERGVIESGKSGVFSSLLTSTLDFVPTFVSLAQVYPHCTLLLLSL